MTRDEAIALARKHEIWQCLPPSLYDGEKIIAAILEAANGRWRPISEAPKDGPVLLHHAMWHQPILVGAYVAGHEAFGVIGWGCPHAQPTHWQPLPPPPPGAGR